MGAPDSQRSWLPQGYDCGTGQLPPEPFYFVIHLDGVIRVWNKVSHKAKAGMSGELFNDGSVKVATVTYAHLRVPGYGHSVFIIRYYLCDCENECMMRTGGTKRPVVKERGHRGTPREPRSLVPNVGGRKTWAVQSRVLRTARG